MVRHYEEKQKVYFEKLNKSKLTGGIQGLVIIGELVGLKEYIPYHYHTIFWLFVP